MFHVFLNRLSRARVGLAWACVLMSPSAAWADFYWEVAEPKARAVVERLPAGSIVVTYCPGCEGFYEVLRINKAKVAEGMFGDGAKQVLLEREILLAGRSTDPDKLVFSSNSQCGAMPKDWCADMIDACPSEFEYLSIPYTYYRKPGGKEWRWVYEGLNAENQIRPPVLTINGRDEQRIEICAESDYPVPKLPDQPSQP